MIQVIGRATRILEFLAAHGEASLPAISDHMQLKKTTACNILKSLTENGLAEKTPGAHYRLGPKIFDWAGPEKRKSAIQALAEPHAARLAARLRERVVIAVLYQDAVYFVARASFERALTIDPRTFIKSSPYSTAVGRLLLSGLSAADLEKFVAKAGLPGDAWRQVRSLAELTPELAVIRKKGLVVKPTDDGEGTSISMPIRGPDQAVWGALGVFLPTIRFQADHQDAILAAMRETIAEMNHLLQSTAALHADAVLA